MTNKNFKEVYKDIMMPMPMLPLFGLGEIVQYAGFRWEVIGFEPNEKEGCWVYDLQKVDGSDEKVKDINELGLMKSYKKEMVEKPGASTHTPKWDRCVEQVESNSDNANAYAVCTAMLGDESFKSMEDSTFDEKIKMYMQKLGISGAGPVPNSLLAAQDLETHKTIKKTQDLNNFAVWYYDASGARKCAVFGHAIDAEAYARIVEVMGFKDIKILKGQVEQTGKQLDAAAKAAQDASEEETKSLVNRIKNIQVKRQKAVLNCSGGNKIFRGDLEGNSKV